MAKLTRIVSRVFGSGSGSDQIAQFGSLFAGTPQFTTDPAVAQSLSNWLTGWFAAAIGGNAPTIEDMNSAMFVMTYQYSYLFQTGVPEWNTSTIYFIGSVVNDGAGVLYVSKTDNNTGNVLSSTTNWKVIAGNIMTALGDLIYGGTNGGDPTRLAGWTAASTAMLTQTGTGSASAAPVWKQVKVPDVQVLTATSGTYSLPANALYLEIEMTGGAGGGGGGGAGVDGTDTTFGTTLLVAGGGTGGSGNGGTQGVGGAASLGTGPVGVAYSGANGDGVGQGIASANLSGGGGGQTPFGGRGAGRVLFAGYDAVQNTGSGGGGGGSATPGFGAASGGGGGGYVKAIISNPSSTYPFAVGVGGTGGVSSGTGAAGGNGADGVIIVKAYFQ